MTYRGTDALVLGIPRGGVLVAAEVARRLEAELDAVITRKLEVPDEPDLAMGALTADGGGVRQRVHRRCPRCHRRTVGRGDRAGSR
jgi:predicted phosphoribosyltransferase